ncbi:MAG: hypothetical protein HYU69_03025 [Bacteroidetes bacterium]|nr:hypothetical protein [Bacteroidota bacterium]
MEAKPIVLIIGAGASHDLHPEFGLGSHLIQHISDRVTDRTSPHDRYLSNLLLELKEEGINTSVCWDFVHHLDEYRRRVKPASIDEFLNETDTYPEFIAVRTKFETIGYFSILFNILGYEGAIKKRPINGETWIDTLAKIIDEKGICLTPNERRLNIITFNYDRNIEHLLYTHDRFKERQHQISAFINKSIVHVYGKVGDLKWQNPSKFFDYGEDNNDWKKILANKDAIKIMYKNRMTDEVEDKVFNWLHWRPHVEVFTLGFSWDMLNYNLLRLRELYRDNTELIVNIHPYNDDEFVYRRAMATKVRSVVPTAQFKYLSCAEFLNETLNEKL